MFVFGLIISTAFLQTLAARTVEVQRVQFGATVSMGCNLTFSYDTAWLRENPHGPPTLLVHTNLRKGDAVYWYQLEPRFTVEFVNRSVTLTIADVNEDDLGLYFCVLFLYTELLIGSGTVLEGPFWFGFYRWYSTAVGGGLLSMMICVCVIHCKTKENRQTSLREERNNSNIYDVQEQVQETSHDPDLSGYV